jgi:PAS domain S-box-containing protein
VSEIDSLLLELEKADKPDSPFIMNKLAFLYRVKDPQKTIDYARQALDISQNLQNLYEQQIAYSNLGLGYRYLGNYNEALTFQQKALELALQLENDSVIAREYNRLGIVYKRFGAYNIALEYYLKALDIHEKLNNQKGMADMFNNIGSIYRKRGNFDIALEYYFKTLKIRKELNDLENYANILNNIGNAYSDLGIYNEALNYHKQSLNVKLELDHQYGISTSYKNIGDVYLDLDEPEKAIEFYFKAYEISKEMNYKGGIAVNLTDIGKANLAMKNFDIAEKNLSESLKIKEEIGDKIGITESYIGFSKLYIQLAAYDKAFEYLDTAYTIAEKEGFPEDIANILMLYSEIYGLTNNPRKSLDYFKKYAKIRDSIFNVEVTNRFVEFQFRLKSEELETEKKLLEEKNKYQQLSLIKKNQFIYLLTAIVILVLFLIVTVFNRYRNKKKANQVLAAKNKSINEQNLFLKVLMNTIPNPMYYTDDRARMLGFNAAFCELHNKTSEEIQSKTVFDLYPLDVALEYHQKDSDLLKSKGMQQFETQIQLPDGKIHDVIFYKNTYEDSNGKVAGLLGIMLDITDRKRIEDQIKKSERQLRELNATKDKFFSIIAHDLSNPFNAISGFIHLLNEEGENFDNKEQKQIIDNLLQASDSITKLLVNLLEWAGAQTHKLQFIPEIFDLNDVTSEIHSIFISAARRKNISITFDIPGNTMVNADKNMTKTVLRNLVSNALKFTNPGGKVEITTRKINGMSETSVTDNGIGIKQDDLKKLFVIDEQFRTKGTANEQGSGIGLILCKEFVEKNGGLIRAESIYGSGSSFIFALLCG